MDGHDPFTGRERDGQDGQGGGVVSEGEPFVQLQMIWPERLLGAPPEVSVPAEYALRTYRPGDEARFFEVGYRHIHLYTEDWRLPAIKIYLRLGYVPYLSAPEMPEQWRAICERLGWPFEPKMWRLDGHRID